MFRFQLVALSGKKFDDNVHEVILPTKDGEIGVLAHHMPLMSVASSGVVAVRPEPRTPDGQREFFAISGGVIEVSNNQLRVLVDEADISEEIDEAEAKEAVENAKKMLADAKDEVSLEQAQQLVDRSAIRLQVAGLKRRTNRRQ